MVMTPKGYAGQYLRVNLTRGKISKLLLPRELARNYIGGSGLAARILYDEVSPEVKPYAPKNLLIFATGPVNGTVFPPSGRYCVVTKNALTGGWGEVHSGGHFGPELKYAGYDYIVIQGRSKKPVYLSIRDDEVGLRDAKELWGRDTAETTAGVREELADRNTRVACIGPGGERLVRYSSIITDEHRAAARSGVGAVMGSKRLKAVAVRGTGDVEVADFDKVWKLSEEAHARYTGGTWGKACQDSLGKYGTTGLIEAEQAIGRLPTKNHWTGMFDYADEIGSENIRRNYRKTRRSCFNCRICCKYVSYVSDGPYAGTWTEGPEYETVAGFGSNCLNADLDSIMYANYLCNLYGIDTISCAKSISFAMECFEHGILTDSDTDGLDLRWGDGDVIVELINKIVEREGIGKLLGEGVKRAAEQIGKGSGRFAMHVKGHENSFQDGRPHQSVGLSHAIAVRGADHLRALSSIDELGYYDVAEKRFGRGKAKDISNLRSTKYKGLLVKDMEDLYAVVDALIICKYGTMWPPVYYLDDFTNLLPAVTGFEEFAEFKEVRAAAERIVNLKRAFNARVGFDRKDDTLPKRFLEEPIPHGPAKGDVVRLKPMLDEYYRERRWDVRTGLQKRETLERFGLKDVSEDLAKRGKLAKR